MTDAEEMRSNLTHNHSLTNFRTLGLRAKGECGACDYARAAYERAAEEGR